MKRAGLAVVALLACAPRKEPPIPQIVVYIDTDAPLPVREGADLHPALFDRARVDMLRDDRQACDDCSREFGIDASSVIEGRVSFGVLSPIGSHPRVRVRLFRSTARLSGEPAPDTTIDVTFRLPEQNGTVVEATTFLPTDQTGHRIGLTVPVPAATGRPSPGHAGTWAHGARTACESAPREGEACVPGGSYFMGNRAVLAGVGAETAADRQRLVVLSPFFLDLHEVTVGEYRRWNRPSDLPPPARWSGKDDGPSDTDFCTLSLDGSRDDRPLNCVGWKTARAFCMSRGGDLPTEAQFEYASSGLGARTWVWGEDEPRCTDAIFGRSFPGLEVPAVCPDHALGPYPVSRKADRDRLVLPTGVIIDLAGNLQEWVRDSFAPQASDCWPSGVSVDPVCELPGTVHSVRGGSWAYLGGFMRAASRGHDKRPGAIVLGFRCARPSSG